MVWRFIFHAYVASGSIGYQVHGTVSHVAFCALCMKGSSQYRRTLYNFAYNHVTFKLDTKFKFCCVSFFVIFLKRE
jgi:hypothetical protein